MFSTALKDAQWLKSLPQTLGLDFEKIIREKPTVDQPVRIEAIASIYSGLPLEPPEGYVYAVHYAGDKTREVFVPTWGETTPDYRDATFLMPGRAGDKMADIKPLMIEDARDSVPAEIKTRLRQFDNERERLDRAAVRTLRR